MNNPSQVVKEGDVVRVVVLSVDLERRRISLSLKQGSPDPWHAAKEKYPKDSWVDATVRSVTDFGAFAELEPGIEGLVHISEMADHRINAVTDVVQVGQTHKCRILEVDTENRRIRLSLRQPPQPRQHAPATAAAAPALKFAAPAKPLRRMPSRPLKGGLATVVNKPARANVDSAEGLTGAWPPRRHPAAAVSAADPRGTQDHREPLHTSAAASLLTHRPR